MNKLRTVILALIVLLASAAPALADGIIIPVPPPPDQPPWRGFPLTIEYHRVKVEIEQQVATTHVDQVFRNDTNMTVEGTYVFPLPEGATVSQFSMWVEGQEVEGKLLTKEEARAIYESYVRRQQDPALLEYVGRGAFQASIFPIPPGEERRVELTYSEVLTLEEGLVRYRYPLDTERFSAQPIEDVSVSVSIDSMEAIKAIYSPSHDVAVDRQGEYRARVGYEEHNALPDQDFEVYYSVAEEDIGLSLMSYQPEDEDGYFLMLVAPQVEVDETEIVAKDVILVLDVSGSMRGDKMQQAKDALAFVLERLQPEDRFSVISFSTGVRRYSRRLEYATEARDAQRWVRSLSAEGGTDINRALLEAAAQAEGDRPTIIIFLTDGLPTEGIVDTESIMSNLDRAADENVRLFTFGVGHDVNTVLLDGLAQAHRGTSGYVTPSQSIEEEVSAFYAKVSAPLLADVQVSFSDLLVEEIYPYPLPDLFAGSQLIVVGRYRQGGPTEVTLSGEINGRPISYYYDDRSLSKVGGDSFVARLWATRKIAHLLDQIRQVGKAPELVDEVINLSLRYGIATPYTSFLVEEPTDFLGDRPEGTPAPDVFHEPAPVLKEALVQKAMTAPTVGASGGEAVADAQARAGMREAERAPSEEGASVKHVGAKTFVNRNGVWVDTLFDAGEMQPELVVFGSDRYFDLASDPLMAEYLSLGSHVVVVHDGQAIRVTPSGESAEPELVVDPDNGGVGDQENDAQAGSSSSLWQAFQEWLSGLFGSIEK